MARRRTVASPVAALAVSAVLLATDRAGAVRTGSAGSQARALCEAEQFRGTWEITGWSPEDEKKRNIHPPHVVQFVKTTWLADLTPWRFRAAWYSNSRMATNASVLAKDAKAKEVVFGDASLNAELCCLVASDARMPYVCLQPEGHIVLFDAKRPRSLWRGPDYDITLAKYMKDSASQPAGARYTEAEAAASLSSIPRYESDSDEDDTEPARGLTIRERREQAHTFTGSWDLNQTLGGHAHTMPDLVQFAEKHALGLVITWRFRAVWDMQDAAAAASGGRHAHDALTGDASWNDAFACVTMSDPRMRYWCLQMDGSVFVYESPRSAPNSFGPDAQRQVARYVKHAHGGLGFFTDYSVTETTPAPVADVVLHEAIDFTGYWELMDGSEDAPSIINFGSKEMLNLATHWRYKATWKREEETARGVAKKVRDSVSGDAIWNGVHGCLLTSDPRLKFWRPQTDGSMEVFEAGPKASIRDGPTEDRRVARYKRRGPRSRAMSDADTYSLHSETSYGNDKNFKAEVFEGRWARRETLNATGDPPDSVELTRSSPQSFLTLWRYTAVWSASEENNRFTKEVVMGEASVNEGSQCIMSSEHRMRFWCMQDDGTLVLLEPMSVRSLWRGPDRTRPVARYEKTAIAQGDLAAEAAASVTAPPSEDAAAAPRFSPSLLPDTAKGAQRFKADMLKGTWEFTDMTSVGNYAPPHTLAFAKATPLGFMALWRYQATWSSDGSRQPSEVASGDASLNERNGCLTTPDTRMSFCCLQEDGTLVLFAAKKANALWLGPDKQRPIARYTRSDSEPGALPSAAGVDDAAARQSSPAAPGGWAASRATVDGVEADRFSGVWQRTAAPEGQSSPSTIELEKVARLGFDTWRYAAVWDLAPGAFEGAGQPVVGEATLNEDGRCLTTGDARMRFWSLRGDGTLDLLAAKDETAAWRGPDPGRVIASYTRRA